MDRKKVVARIGDLLDCCKTCPRHKLCNNTKPSIICGGCRNYTELRKLGDSLIHDEGNGGVKTVRKELLKDLTVDRYLEAIHSYPTKSKAALALGATYQVLSNWEKKHESQIKLAMSENYVDKASESKDQQPATDNLRIKSKLMANIDDLTVRLKTATDQQGKMVQENKQLKAALKDKQTEIENLNSAAADLENEIDQAKQTNKTIKNKYYQSQTILSALERYVLELLKADSRYTNSMEAERNGQPFAY